MKVSVITAVLNARDTLADTVDSVSRQTHSDREHIIIDGGSDDGTVDVLRACGNSVTQWISEPDRGIYDAMNKGIRLAEGDIIGLLNADDVYADERVLERVVAAFREHDVEACYGDLVYVRATDLSRVVRYWRSRSYQPGLFERGWMPAHPTFFVRRETYRRLGLYNLRLRFQADFELTARFMAAHRITTHYIPEVLVRMRMGGTTNRSLANIVRGNLESYRAIRRMGLNVTPLHFATKFAMRLPQFFHRPGRPETGN